MNGTPLETATDQSVVGGLSVEYFRNPGVARQIQTSPLDPIPIRPDVAMLLGTHDVIINALLREVVELRSRLERVENPLGAAVAELVKS